METKDYRPPWVGNKAVSHKGQFDGYVILFPFLYFTRGHICTRRRVNELSYGPYKLTSIRPFQTFNLHILKIITWLNRILIPFFKGRKPPLHLTGHDTTARVAWHHYSSVSWKLITFVSDNYYVTHPDLLHVRLWFCHLYPVSWDDISDFEFIKT